MPGQIMIKISQLHTFSSFFSMSSIATSVKVIKGSINRWYSFEMFGFEMCVLNLIRSFCRVSITTAFPTMKATLGKLRIHTMTSL